MDAGLLIACSDRGPMLVILQDAGVDAGTIKLVGTNKQMIVYETMRLLNDSEAYQQMAYAHNPYGDGSASEKIMEVLTNYEQKAGLE